MSTSSETNELRSAILNFRVSELQVLLGFAGRNKGGKKQELQQRALDLLRIRSTPIMMKIKELHRRSAGKCSHDLDVLPRSSSGLGAATSLDPTTIGNGLSNIPQSRICAVPPMKRDDNPSLQQHGNLALLQRQAAAAIGAAGLYNFPMSHVASSVTSNPAQLLNQYPIHPDVRFKTLPFYEQVAEILKPTSLQQNIPNSQHQSMSQVQRSKEAEYAFYMTPHQVHMLLMSKDYKPGEAAVQLQLRLCALDSSVAQDDAFPPGLIVKVNGRVLALPNAIPTNKPGAEPKRPPKPLNITTLCHTNPNLPNKLHVTWNHEYGKAFVCAVYLVQRHDANALLDRLKRKGRMPVERTKELIRKALSPEGDDDICLESLSVSLFCPLGQCRVSVPCRPIGCSHLNCFDATFYLMMNEKKPTWICAVCNRNISFDDLYIDAYMEEVCMKAPPECREVQFKEDGSWFPVVEEKDDSKKRKRNASESDDSDSECKKRKAKSESAVTNEVTIDLTETTDEEDNAPSPPATRTQPTAINPPSSSSRSQHASSNTTQRHFNAQDILTSSAAAAASSSSSSSSTSSTSSSQPQMNPRSVVQSLVAARAWPGGYSSMASGSGQSGNYYGASGYPAEYFSQAAVAAAAAAAASGSGSGVGQNMYPPSAYGGPYDIYQLLSEERNHHNQRSGPRDIINLD